MSLMKWDDIHDPTGEFDFHMEWTLVSGQYTPEEIQALIDKSGIQGMVRTVNEHMKLTHGHNALLLAWSGGRKAVTQA